MRKFEWNYQIEEWTPDRLHVRDFMAAADNLHVAIAAYEIACRERPGRLITLRNGARVLRESMPEVQ